jgi:tryptophan synthase
MFAYTSDEEGQAALKNDIDYATVLSMLREARSKGLTVPVILMGNYSRHVDDNL